MQFIFKNIDSLNFHNLPYKNNQGLQLFIFKDVDLEMLISITIMLNLNQRNKECKNAN